MVSYAGLSFQATVSSTYVFQVQSVKSSHVLYAGNVTSHTEHSLQSVPSSDDNTTARKQAIMELLQTEKEYCDRLRNLREGFIKPLRDARGEICADMKVFDDVEVLLRSNDFFLIQLKTRYFFVAVMLCVPPRSECICRCHPELLYGIF